MKQFAADPRALLSSRLVRETPELPLIAGLPHEISLERAMSLPGWNAALSRTGDGRLLATTSALKWSFAMVLWLPDHRNPGVLFVELEVVEGQIGISVIDGGLKELVVETFVSVERKRNTVILPLAASGARKGLMIRYGARETPSHTSISRVTFSPNGGQSAHHIRAMVMCSVCRTVAAEHPIEVFDPNSLPMRSW